jgi:voltage-gated potassium channel
MYGIVNISFMNMFKNLMKNRDVAFTGILLVVSLTLFLVCIMEFETKNFNITSIPEGLYFMIVTMTTVGYGDYFPLGTKG